jgi:hypothetical protein
MGDLQVQLCGRVLRLDPRRRIVVVLLPRVGEGRSFRTDYALLPDEPLAPARQFVHGYRAGRTVGGVVAVRPTEAGAEVDVNVADAAAWRRLGDRKVRVDVTAAFTGTIGPNPIGGRVERVEID